MKLLCLGSSSAGNCYALEFHNGEIVLLECGISWEIVMSKLGMKVTNIIACLITHEHKDHSKYVKDIMRNNIPIYTSCGTAEMVGIEKYARLHTIATEQRYDINEYLFIIPYNCTHNAKEPLVFTIFDKKSKTSLLFMTDTAYLDINFSGFDYYMIECNYVDSILTENLEKYGGYRHSDYHMSLETCVRMLSETDLSKCKQIILLHLSENHSDKELMISTIEELTNKNVDVASTNKEWIFDV